MDEIQIRGREKNGFSDNSSPAGVDNIRQYSALTVSNKLGGGSKIGRIRWTEAKYKDCTIGDQALEFCTVHTNKLEVALSFCRSSKEDPEFGDNGRAPNHGEVERDV